MYSKKRTVKSENSPAEKEVWKRMYTLIQSIQNDRDIELPAALADRKTDAATLKYTADFIARVNRIPNAIHPRSTSSLIPQWVSEYQQRDWLVKIQDKWLEIETKTSHMKENIQEFMNPLVSVLEVLSQRMQPVPAVRDAGAVEEKVYKPRRRAIEAADLPVFNPLFCTAIEREAVPVTITGLKPETEYTMSLFDVHKPERNARETVVSSQHGGVVFPISDRVKQLEKDAGEPTEYAWFLEENSESTDSNNWISGFVWLESEQTYKLSQEAYRILADAVGGDHEETDIETLIEINLFLAREFYMKAYERARQGLLFLPKLSCYESKLPYQEVLWQFIIQLIDKIIAKLEKSRTTFRDIKPAWNAVESLQELRKQIDEWE